MCGLKSHSMSRLKLTSVFVTIYMVTTHITDDMVESQVVLRLKNASWCSLYTWLQHYIMWWVYIGIILCRTLHSIKKVDATNKVENNARRYRFKQVIYRIGSKECSALDIIVMAVYQDMLDRYLCVTWWAQRTVCSFESICMSVPGMPNVEAGKDPFFMAWQPRIEHIWQCRQSSMEVIINLVPRYLPYPPDSFPYSLPWVVMWLLDISYVVILYFKG